MLSGTLQFMLMTISLSLSLLNKCRLTILKCHVANTEGVATSLPSFRQHNGELIFCEWLEVF